MNENNNNVENEESKKTKWLNKKILAFSVSGSLILIILSLKEFFTMYWREKEQYSVIEFIKLLNKYIDKELYYNTMFSFIIFAIMLYISTSMLNYSIIGFKELKKKSENIFYNELIDCIPNYNANLKRHRRSYVLLVFVVMQMVMTIAYVKIIELLSNVRLFNSIRTVFISYFPTSYNEILYTAIELMLIMIMIFWVLYLENKYYKDKSDESNDYILGMKKKINHHMDNNNYTSVEEQTREINTVKLVHTSKADWEGIITEIISLSISLFLSISSIQILGDESTTLDYIKVFFSIVVILIFVIPMKHNRISFIKCRELVDYALEEYKFELLEDDKIQKVQEKQQNRVNKITKRRTRKKPHQN